MFDTISDEVKKHRTTREPPRVGFNDFQFNSIKIEIDEDSPVKAHQLSRR